MPLRYTLRQLEYFVAVGETGSIAAASQQVNVSSPSISASVSQLEDELGVQLFVRHHAQGLTPTLAGRKLLDHAKVVLHQAAALRDLAGDLSGSVRGPLTIGCLSTFAQVLLPGLRRSFVEQHSDVRIRQIEADQSKLVRPVAPGQNRPRRDLRSRSAVRPDLRSDPRVAATSGAERNSSARAICLQSQSRNFPRFPWCCSICRIAQSTFCHSSRAQGCAQKYLNGRATWP